MNTTNTRRAALKLTGGALAYATGAGAFALATAATSSCTAKAATVEAAAWDRAYAAFRKVQDTNTALWDRWEQADTNVGKHAPGRVDRYFDEYNLGIGMKPENVIFRLEVYNATHPENRVDVAKTAAEFNAYSQQILDAREHFQTELRYQEARAFGPSLQAARDVIMAVPAPTLAALLVKMKLGWADEDYEDAVIAEAERLFGGEA